MDKVVLLIRHGETTGDIEKRYGGDYDDELTATGVTQAHELANWLAKSGSQALLTSPLKRAKHTAEIIGAKLNLDPEIYAGIKERNTYGIVTGLMKDEAATRYPEVVSNLADPTNTIEGAEPYSDFIVRVKETLAMFANRTEQTIAAITHGGFIRGLCRSVLAAGELKKVDDCAYLTLSYDSQKNKWHLKGLSGASLGIDTTDNMIKRAKIILWRPKDDSIEFMITREPNDNEWSLPGGTKDETDPSIATTAARELREELGIDLGDNELVDTGLTHDYVHNKPRNWKHGMAGKITFFTYRYIDNPLDLDDEVAELKWITLDTMDTYSLQPELLENIRRAVSHLQQSSQ